MYPLVEQYDYRNMKIRGAAVRRGLQGIMGILTIIPLVFGVLNFWIGAEMHLPAEHVNPNVDSHVRFQFTWFFGLAALFWYMIPRIEDHTTLFRIIVAVMFLGGLGRLLSMVQVGVPDAPIVAAMVLELLMPVLIPWQSAVARRAGRSAI